MNSQFWHDRWQLDEIGFHQRQFHPLLVEHWPLVCSGGAPGQVFVPLCGKSLDMVWLLQQGHSILGVELSPIAIADFFRERTLAADVQPFDAVQRFESPGYRLLCGDFFDLRPKYLQNVQAVYDRAALIALPHSLQVRYVEHLLHLLPERPPMLLITLEYDPQEMEGPPFSTSEERVTALFKDRYEVVKLSARDVLDEHPGLKNKGLTGLTEIAYRLRAPAGAE
jgi:thiopurine S-methyltransferase